MNIIHPGMPSPQREMKRASPQMEESANGKRTVDMGTMTDLFDRHAPSLFAYFRQHTDSREDAEDLLHEVFAAVLQQALWLWRVARNKTIDTYRRKTRRPSLALNYVADELFAGDEQSPEYAALRHEEYTRLLAALEQMPALQQEALWLRFVYAHCSDSQGASSRGSRESHFCTCSPGLYTAGGWEGGGVLEWSTGRDATLQR